MQNHITQHLHIKLQEKDKLLVEIYNHIIAFQNLLVLFKNQIEENLDHF